jgi:hypothetical protein
MHHAAGGNQRRTKHAERRGARRAKEACPSVCLVSASMHEFWRAVDPGRFFSCVGSFSLLKFATHQGNCFHCSQSYELELETCCPLKPVYQFTIPPSIRLSSSPMFLIYTHQLCWVAFINLRVLFGLHIDLIVF